MPGLDTNIPLSTTVPQSRSFLGTLGALSQFREQQQLNQSRQQQIDQRQRELEDDAAMREATARLQDPDKAIAELYQRGRPSAAAKLSKNVLDTRNEQNEGLSKLVDSHQKAIDFASNIMSTASDDKSYAAALPAAATVLKSAGLDQVVGLLPTTYDPAAVKNVVDMGAGASRKLKLEKEAVDLKAAGDNLLYAQHTDAENHDKAAREADGYYTKSAATILADAKSQADLDNKQRMLAQAKIPLDVIARFGNTWTPDYGKKALALGMSPAEASNAQHQQTQEGFEKSRVAVEQGQLGVAQSREAREAADAAKGPNGKPMTQNEVATVERWKANQLGELERRYRGGPNADPSVPLKLKPDAQHQMGQEKLQVEDAYRAQMGRPSLFQEEQDAAMAGDQKKLRQVRNQYRALTVGEDTPREQIEKVTALLKSEKNPTKAEALRQQLKSLMSSYGTKLNTLNTPLSAPEQQPPSTDE